jgi:hypothetical protein
VTRRLRAPWPPLAVLLVLVAACGGTTASASPAGTGTSAPSPTAAVSSSAAASGSPAAALVDIPGTHVRMVSPEGFVPAADFPGFQRTDGSSILVSEVPGSYTELVKGLTVDRLASSGISITSKTEVEVDGRPAVLVEGAQTANGAQFGKIMLVTGTAKSTVVITGSYPLSASGVRQTLHDAVLTVSFDPDRVIDPTAGLHFTITPAAPLRFAGALANTGAYDTSGTIPAADPMEPSLFVAPSLGETPVGNVAAFAKARLEQTVQISDVKIGAATAVTIAGLDGVELIGTATHQSGAPVFVYQVLLVQSDGTGYVLMSGRCRIAEQDQCLTMFRSSVATYAAKP